MGNKKVESKNEWKVVSIEELPDNVPVLMVTQMPSKEFAKFHLAEYVLVPMDGVWPKQTEIKVPATFG